MAPFSRLILAFAVALMILPGDSQAQSAVYPINLDQISDPDVRDAVEKVNKKQAEIKEVVIEEQKTVFTVVGKVQNSIEAKVYRRAPNLMLRQSTYQGGNVIGQLFDGKFYWELNFAPPAQVRKLEADMKARNAAQADIDKAVAAQKTTYSKADLAKLKTGGVLDDFFFMDQFAACPFAIANLDTLSLNADTPAEWAFSGKTRKNPYVKEGMGMEFSVDKSNGQCTGLKLTAVTGNEQIIVTNGKMSVNPAKKIEDKTFQYQPPAGVTFADVTDRIAAEFKTK
ncbi:MAG: hypothetical protein ABFD69_06090 [Candidatus Sumerlaeia bacterium]